MPLYPMASPSFVNVNTGTLVTTGDITDGGSETVAGTLGVTGNTTLTTVTTSGAATLNSAGVTNNATVGGTLGVTGVTTVGTINSTTSAVSGNETVGGTLTVTGTSVFTSNSTGAVSPSTHNLVAWTYDPVLAQNSSLMTNGTVYLSAVYLNRTVNVTKIYWEVATIGNTPTSTQNVVGIYNSSGTLLQSANVDADISSTGLKTTTITSQSVTAGSFYWIGFVFNASVAPTLARGTGVTGSGTFANAGLTAASFRFATNGTTQTTLPTPITPSSNVATTFGGPWAAIGV